MSRFENVEVERSESGGSRLGSLKLDYLRFVPAPAPPVEVILLVDIKSPMYF